MAKIVLVVRNSEHNKGSEFWFGAVFISDQRNDKHVSHHGLEQLLHCCGDGAHLPLSG